MATKTRINDIEIPTKILEVGDKFYFNRKLQKKARTSSPLYEITYITSDGFIDLIWKDENGKDHSLNKWLELTEAQRYVKDGTITFPKPPKSPQSKKKSVSSATTLPQGTNSKYIPLINIENPLVIKKGDLFYFYASIDSPCYISGLTPNGNVFDFTRYVIPNNPQYESIQELKLREFIKEDDAFLCRFTDGGYFVNKDNTFSLTIDPIKSDDSFEMIVNENGVERKGGLPNAEQLAMFICANKLTPKIAPLGVSSNVTMPQSSQTQTTKITSIKPLQRFDLFQREKDFKLYSLDSTDSGSFDVDDDELLSLKFESAKRLEVLEIPYNTLLEDINKGEIFHFGQVRVGDEFVGNVDIKYVVRDVTSSNVRYEMFNLTTQENIGYNSLPIEAFVDMLLTNQCILTNRNSQMTSTPQPNKPFDASQLNRYDLFKYYGKTLFFVAELDLLNDIIVLFSRDNTNGKFDFARHTFTTKDLEDLVSVGTLDYVGAIMDGDEFIDESKKFSKLITLIQTPSLPAFDDLLFDNIDIDKAKVISQDVMRRNDFVKMLVSDGYKLQRRGNVNNPQATPMTPNKLEVFDMSTWDMVFNKNTNTLFVVIAIKNFVNDADIDFEYNGRKLIGTSEKMTLMLSFINQKIQEGELVYLGQPQVGDEFSYPNGDRKWVITKIDGYEIYYENVSKSDPNDSQFDRSDFQEFFRYVIEYAMNIDRAMLTNRNVPNVPNVAPKPLITDTEIDALKKDLSDLLFLKSGISDLEFEDKINISTDIFETQRKIDDLTEKLFEQRVGDENFFDRLFDQSFTPLRDRYDMVIQKNDLPEIISPSGEMSDLDEDMHQIINSNDFKEWFGDWRNAFFYRNLPDFGGLNVSKVLTDKFEPQIVWHGTNNEFSYFDFEMFPANYFAVNKEYSEFFATNKGGRGYVLPFFLNIKHPLDLTDFGNNYVTTKDFFDWMFLMTGMSAEELQVNPMFLDPNCPPSPIWGYIRSNPTMLQKISEGKVYDGIKFYEFNPNEENNPDKKAYETLAYIIFDPHQAKLADPNRGDIMLASLKSFMLKRGGKI
jgi:hypothetical protein